MGEVYRARDTRLERTVAIKVLPHELSSSPELRQRFEREAKTVSQLSHPHICAIYDVGRAGDTDYLVMEFLEGEVLSTRLAKGPLPIDDVLRYGIQIADALDRAHRSGIVHRDLKPGNIMLARSGVKLLDFGLAKSVPAHIGRAAPGDGETSLPTRADLTQEGTILGTVQYMAPEQLEGKEADTRTDIFALGAVLYEMATGRKAFAAGSQASLITAIMSAEPQRLSSVQPMVPPLLDRLIHSCLAKDRDDRVQTAHDALLQLRWIAEGSQVATPQPVTTRRKHRERLAWTVAAAALAAAAWLGVNQLRAAPVPAEAARVVRSAILLPDKTGLNSAEISPDGTRVVFSGTDATGKVQLWVRALDADTATPLSGTESGILPFWSPDGRYIGFFADKKLKRIEAAGGGAPLSLYDIDGVGGTWAPSGDILVSAPSGPIQRLPAAGGQATPVTTLDASHGERRTATRSCFPTAGTSCIWPSSCRGTRGIPQTASGSPRSMAAPPSRYSLRTSTPSTPTATCSSCAAATREAACWRNVSTPRGSKRAASPSRLPSTSRSTATTSGSGGSLCRPTGRFSTTTGSSPRGSSGTTARARRWAPLEKERRPFAPLRASRQTERESPSMRTTRERRRPRCGSATSVAVSRRA